MGEVARSWHRLDVAHVTGGEMSTAKKSYFIKAAGAAAALSVLTDTENGYGLNPKTIAVHPRLVSLTDEVKYVGEHGHTTPEGSDSGSIALDTFVIPTPPEQSNPRVA